MMEHIDPDPEEPHFILYSVLPSSTDDAKNKQKFSLFEQVG
jgi:hypothetical protein